MYTIYCQKKSANKKPVSSNPCYRNDIIEQFDQKFQLLTAVCQNLEQYLAQARSAVQSNSFDCGIVNAVLHVAVYLGQTTLSV